MKALKNYWAFGTSLFLLVLLPCLALGQQVNLNRAVKFTGEAAADTAGNSVSSAGDINGDGYEDFLTGASGSANGAVYLIYGQDAAFTSASLSQAVKFTGEASGDQAGYSVASAGDINNDGYGDILIGAPETEQGTVYLIYGQATAFTSASLSTAIKFTGEVSGDKAGYSVSSAGDVNTDGYDDFLIGAIDNDDSEGHAGAVYLVYGQSALYASVNSLSSYVEFTGEADSDYAGYKLSTAGDVNHDGYGDFLISAYSNGNSHNNAGAVYLFYGQSAAFASASLSTAGAIFQGENTGDYSGTALSSADVNGDGYTDIIIGARKAEVGGVSNSGSVYLIYGGTGATALTGAIDLSVADTKFSGLAEGDFLGTAIASADINYDTYGDLIIGSEAGNGAVHMVFGQAAVIASQSLSSSDATFQGEAAGDIAGAAVGAADVNHDTFVDMLVGAPGESTIGTSAGAVYVGYIYMDEDGDGIPGDGLLEGTDPNEKNIEIGNDGIDNDGDGTVDEVNTLEENGIHPTYGLYDPADTTLYPLTVISVVGSTLGNIQVTYIDNSVYQYHIFPKFTGEKLTKVKRYKKTGYFLVLHPKGKRLKLVNIYNGEILSSALLSKKIKYKYNSIKVIDLRLDGSKEVVVTSKSVVNNIRASVIKVNLTATELVKKDSVKLINKKIVPRRTRGVKSTLRLRDSKLNVIKSYKVNKLYELVALI